MVDRCIKVGLFSNEMIFSETNVIKNTWLKYLRSNQFTQNTVCEIETVQKKFCRIGLKCRLLTLEKFRLL